MDPLNRLTALDALRHPYFDGLRDEELESRLKSIPSSPSQRTYRGQKIQSANKSNEKSKTVMKNKQIGNALSFNEKKISNVKFFFKSRIRC
jgi:hypothetical protein